jgi:hypothetical protein
VWAVSDLAIEDIPERVAEPAREAAQGQVVYITDRGRRLTAMVPAELAAGLERLTADELEEMADQVASSGHDRLAALLEELADRAAILEARSDAAPAIPLDDLEAEFRS